MKYVPIIVSNKSKPTPGSRAPRSVSSLHCSVFNKSKKYHDSIDISEEARSSVYDVIFSMVLFFIPTCSD